MDAKIKKRTTSHPMTSNPIIEKRISKNLLPITKNTFLKNKGNYTFFETVTSADK
jgi:hypothetical protein